MTEKTKRGYFGIGIFEPKFEENLGTMWRSAHFFDADFIFTIGDRYKKSLPDTSKAMRHIPYYSYKDFSDFHEHVPGKDTKLIAVELTEQARPLETFIHPERAIYLLGGEDRTLPEEITRQCPATVKIATKHSLNVAVTASIVLYDRHAKAFRA